MTATTRRSYATPRARRSVTVAVRKIGPGILQYRAHIVVDLAVAALVLALPLSLRGSPAVASAVERKPVAAAASVPDETARAETVSRSRTITAASGPATSVADDVRPIQHYVLGAADTLQSVANFYHVSAEAIAISNGIADPWLKNQQGREIQIPPGEGALYTVQAGDTVESVAEHFKVEPAVIMSYNRLYFEPEHFAPGQLIFVANAALKPLVWETADVAEAEEDVPSVLSRPAVTTPSPNGKLAWPVAGVITQYFWALHSGVDMAAPYGTGIGASDAGTVVATGWVAVGGLSVRIQHPSGLETGYYHMGAIYVTVGQKVAKGQIVGTVGMTGITTGPHVHWELKQNGAFVNPLLY